MNEKRFNIRVYGILINDRHELLVMDERYKSVQFTKFPGGGLEWGEGTRDCLQREFLEELNQPIQVMDHFYTTDFFLASAFRADDQLVSIYYRVKLVGELKFIVNQQPFSFSETAGDQAETPRWIPLSALDESAFRWPIDKKVVSMLRAEFKP